MYEYVLLSVSLNITGIETTEFNMKQGNATQSYYRPPRFARAKAVCNHFQIAKSTLWLWAKTRPGFPPPLKAGEKVTLFDIHAIEDYLRASAGQGM
jgi:predicted DNA-binding transcriptional regulator AlpA